MDSNHIIIIAFCWLLCANAELQADDCISKKNNAHWYLGAKTPYRVNMNANESRIEYSGCRARQIWMAIRHGTRYPGNKMIRKMREDLPILRDKILQNHHEGRGSLCGTELKFLKGWEPFMEDADQKRLAHEGEDEMIELAERFQNRFPEILSEKYDNSSFKFRYTAAQRSEASARYFSVGLFGKKESRYVWFPEPLKPDPIIKFYKLCTKWIKEVDKNPSALSEKTKFLQGPEMRQAIAHISSHLGFKQNLKLDIIHLMYMTCSFETACNRRQVSPWCAVFSKEDFEVIEYSEDLDYYYIDGYGFDINHRQACPAFVNLVAHFRMVINGEENQPKGIFYFTHSGALLKMLAHLGLYKDSPPLLHDNYSHMKDRKWKVSRNNAFGNNLAFVLFECEHGFQMLSLHQEKAVTLPGCQDAICPFDTFLKTFNSSIEDCNFNKMCCLDTNL